MEFIILLRTLVVNLSLIQMFPASDWQNYNPQHDYLVKELWSNCLLELAHARRVSTDGAENDTARPLLALTSLL